MKPGPRLDREGRPEIFPAGTAARVMDLETAPDGPATRRLHAMFSRLNLKGTPIEGWKLKISSATCGVESGP